MPKYFSFDHENGFQVWKTPEEAHNAAQAAIDDYRDAMDDEGWYDEVEAVCWGQIGAEAKAVKLPDWQGTDYELQETV
ncbi:MAG: hypothetical protein ACRCXB_15270 [Aeromonadaceae bacterium]